MYFASLLLFFGQLYSLAPARVTPEGLNCYRPCYFDDGIVQIPAVVLRPFGQIFLLHHVFAFHGGYAFFLQRIALACITMQKTQGKHLRHPLLRTTSVQSLLTLFSMSTTHDIGPPLPTP
jgi:hypothetical protein